MSGNAPLRGYYEAAGFVHQRDVERELTTSDGTTRAGQTNPYERPCRLPGR